MAAIACNVTTNPHQIQYMEFGFKCNARTFWLVVLGYIIICQVRCIHALLADACVRAVLAARVKDALTVLDNNSRISGHFRVNFCIVIDLVVIDTS